MSEIEETSEMPEVEEPSVEEQAQAETPMEPPADAEPTVDEVADADPIISIRTKTRVVRGPRSQVMAELNEEG